jgi:hypothetical protein
VLAGIFAVLVLVAARLQSAWRRDGADQERSRVNSSCGRATPRRA